MENEICGIDSSDMVSLVVDVTTLYSPGPSTSSSGYGSADDRMPYMLQHSDVSSVAAAALRYGSTHDDTFLSDYNSVAPSVAFDTGAESADSGTAGGMAAGLHFDDVMDTLWDPFGGDTCRMSDSFGADVEMKEDTSRFVTSASLGTSYGSDDCLLSSSQIPTVHRSTSQQYLGTNLQPTHISQNRRRVTSTMSNLQQYMASQNDIVNTDDFTMQPSEVQRVTRPDLSVVAGRICIKPDPMRLNVQRGGTARLCASAVTTLKQPSSRIICSKLATTSQAPGRSVIRNSVSMPSVSSAYRSCPTVTNNEGSRMIDARSQYKRTVYSPVKGQLPRAAQTVGGCASATHPELLDHRYTNKQLHNMPSNESSHLKLRKVNTVHGMAAGGYGTSVDGRPVVGGYTSILEAFLRSTKHMDPNKGSNAALAAEGISYLCIDDASQSILNDTVCSTGGDQLKQLLTTEMDVLAEPFCIESQQDTLCNLPIDSLLTDGFGLDSHLSLDDPRSIGIGLLGDDVTDDFDITLLDEAETSEDDQFWKSTTVSHPHVSSSELEEILREQTRQDDLWLQHYLTDSL